MSEFREDLLISPINKKRIIGIFLVSILLISLFAFSVLFYSFLFESQRPFPSDQLSEAEWEDADLTLPPSPYNFSGDDFNDLNLTLDQLQDLLDTIQDMFDGDIDDFDQVNFSQSQLALLASEAEVFRLYEYDFFDDMTNKLWKYECFDEYTGDGWHSTAATQLSDFYPYSNYSYYHWDKDLFRIRMPLSPTIGVNSFVIPTLFPRPLIIESGIYSIPPNLNFGSEDLYIDDLNSSILEVDFISSEDTNLSYYLFGLDLPDNNQINNTAAQAQYTPLSIQSRYLQLPPSINVYLANNPYVYNHFIILNNTINQNDNAFVVANKIRNYFQTYFTFPLDPDDYVPAPDGRDVVDWFCETQIGTWADFASAFCVFTRLFGIASRFVDGFNSFGIEEFWDPLEMMNTSAIKYRNLYNWAEIFIPTDTLGNGLWVQMDILFDSFGAGGNPIIGGDYRISASSDNFIYNRGDSANLTAYLSSSTEPIDNKRITFRDVSNGEILGSSFTDINGQASILTNINNSKIVGPHVIEARFDFFIANYTFLIIEGEIQVRLTNVYPTTVNTSGFTDIQGYLYDPIKTEAVKDAQVNFILFQNGTNNKIFNAFIPPFRDTDLNGNFDDTLNLNPSVDSGLYEIRVDFNGTFSLPNYPNLPPSFTYNPITNSSQRVGLNVTKPPSVLFYINNLPIQDVNNPKVYRYNVLNLTAKVLVENVGPLQGQRVYFYDHTQGGIEIGYNITDVNGIASINYFIGDNSITGPNLLYARHYSQENYSYFILNEEPLINIISGPNPREINRTATGATNTQFSIEGEILDTTNFNRINNCELTLKLLRFGLDYSSYLIPSEYIWTSDGYFNLPFEVAPNIPTGNYTLRLDFNGTFDRFGEPYPYYFTLPIINTSSAFPYELLISTPTTLSFNFWINGTTSNDYNQPVVNRNGDLDLTVYLTYGGVPIADGEIIYFYDITQEFLIGTASTTLGFAQLIYSTNPSTVAGPHLLRARWGSNYNYSYFILDEPIILNLASGPIPREINRGQTNFNLHGYVNDIFNGLPIKFARISVYMVDGGTDYTSYLRLIGGSYQLGINGEFDLTFSVLSSTPDKNFTLQIEFNGIFSYSSPRNYNNEHDFYLAFPNFYDLINCTNELKVIDPENLNINLAVEGNPTLPFYDNAFPPESYYFGEIAHVQVQIIHALPKAGNTVYLYDDFTNNLISSSTFPDESGFTQFDIPTNTLHAGLIRFRVNYHTYSTFNTTYIVINETISISINSNRNNIQRNIQLFNVNGNLQQNGTNLDGLTIGMLLLDDVFTDVSAYVNFNGPQFRVVSNGNYFYIDNSIFLNCPPGNYYLLVYFTGSISESGISLTNYMIPSMSMLVPINITAGTSIIGNYDTRVVKDQFYEGDDLYAWGYLRWDNGSALAFNEVNVTIRDSLGNIISSGIGFTDINGFFNITIPVGAGWPDNAQVWVNFYPKDNFGAPFYYFIKAIEQQLFRQP
ncbi:MAG: transglutaminase-like domain-containing protein [Promethearchaeota archaeon]